MHVYSSQWFVYFFEATTPGLDVLGGVDTEPRLLESRIHYPMIDDRADGGRRQVVPIDTNTIIRNYSTIAYARQSILHRV